MLQNNLNMTRSFFFVIMFFALLNSHGDDLSLDSLFKKRSINLEHAELFSKIPIIDNDGRIKPFHTMASEIIRKVSRKSMVHQQTPSQIVLGMSVDPFLWRIIPIINVKDEDVLKLIEYEGTLVPFISFFSEKGNYILTPYVESAYSKKPIDRTKFDKHVIQIDERVNICSMIFSGNLISLFPLSDGTWSQDLPMSVPGVDSVKTLSFQAVYRDLVFSSFETGIWDDANSLLDFIHFKQEEHASSFLPSVRKINLEVFYNNLNPFGWKLVMLYLLSGLALLIVLLFNIFSTRKQKDDAIIVKIFQLIIGCGFFFHLYALILRWYVSGHAPWSNAYESVIFIAFATMIAGLIFSRKSNFALVASCIVTSMLLFVANINWLDPELTNLVPVLKSYWLMIHVSVITSSYGFFGLSAFIGLLNMVFFIPRRNDKLHANIVDSTIINEQSMMIGLFLLTVGTFLGGVWANESWGRYWGWDPKETWALVSIIVYTVILHIRLLKSKRYVYWFNLFALFGFSAILMTYFGVNYYLDGLHSYAAGDSFPIPTFVPWTFCFLALISIISFVRFNKTQLLDE